MIDDIRLPEKWSKGSAGGPAFATRVVKLEGGGEDREERQDVPLWDYDIAHNIKSPGEIAALRSFHLSRRGASRGYLLKDWIDWTSASDGISAPAMTDQPLGTGTGSQTEFALIKRYADAVEPFDRPIAWPVAGTLLVAVNGVAKITGVSVDRGTGVVTLTPAPVAADVITAGFGFDVPVRFAEDLLSVSWDTINSRSTGSVPLMEVRE